MNDNRAIDDSLMVQVAALCFGQVGEPRIAEELKITRHKVRKIKASAEFKAYLKDIGDRATEMAVASFRQKLDLLEPLAYEALKKGLTDGKLEAVRIWAETVGLKEKNAPDQAASSLTVVLPGASAPMQTVIEVKGETDENESTGN